MFATIVEMLDRFTRLSTIYKGKLAIFLGGGVKGKIKDGFRQA
jgi:hypothetical protein